MDAILTWLPLIVSIVIVILLGLILRKVSARGGEKTEEIIREEFRASRDEAMQSARSLREELAATQKDAHVTVIQAISEMNKSQRDSLAAIEQRIRGLSDTLDLKMKALQESNDRRLDQMRQTVDEKLQSTLEKRLGESFKIVSERLEAVQRGLGEMQNLATGVGDLKRVLTNVKARGTWGEVQLGAILEQLLTPDQYEKNVKVRPSSGEVVEFAIRLPGTGSEANTNVWLPIDAKFPQEDYQRLVQASEAADTNAVEQSLKALTRAIENSARDISEKYIEPPATTDFAILFLPTEGCLLYTSPSPRDRTRSRMPSSA